MAMLGNMYFGTHGNAKKHLVTCSDLIVDVMQLKGGVLPIHRSLIYTYVYNHEYPRHTHTYTQLTATPVCQQCSTALNVCSCMAWANVIMHNNYSNFTYTSTE